MDKNGKDIFAMSRTYPATSIEKNDAFRAWWRESKVGSNGEPSLLYHGSYDRFRAFDETKFQKTDCCPFGVGIYLSAHTEIAACYGPYVMVLLASVQNLLVWPFPYREHELFAGATLPGDDYEKARLRTKIMREAGYDGCVGRNPLTGHTDWVVFSPLHVKSVWNEGTWSLNNPDLFQ